MDLLRTQKALYGVALPLMSPAIAAFPLLFFVTFIDDINLFTLIQIDWIFNRKISMGKV